MMDQQTRIQTADGFELATVATHGERSDIVIWMHGISMDKDEYLGFFYDGANALAYEGYPSIRFDFRGHGDSQGNSLDFSIVNQTLDVEAVIKFVQNTYGSSPFRLHLVGASFGAPSAVFAAARHPDMIQTVCLISPVLSYQRTFLKPETEWATELFGEGQMQMLERTGRLQLDSEFCIARRLVEEMHVVRPDVALRELRQSVLVFHGNCDSMVPYDATVEACRGLNHVRLVTMDGIDHGYMVLGDDEGLAPQSIANKKEIYRQLIDFIRGG